MKKINSIEYLRVFSILYIVGFWHLFNYTDAFPAYQNPLTSRITLIVLGLFVLISGFLIGASAKKRKGALDFYKKRVLRIYPLYAAAVLIFYFYGINDFESSVKALLLVSMYYGPAPWTLWFITMLMLLYLVTPILYRFIESPVQYWGLICAIVFVSLLLRVTYGGVDMRVMLYLPCYAIGLYCSRYGFAGQLVNNRNALFVLVAGVIFSGITSEFYLLNQLKHIPMVVASSYLILSISYFNETKFRSVKIIAFLGYSSYAIYLFHRPIFISLKSLYFPQNELLQALYLITVCLLAIFVFSWSVQKSYDKIVSNLYPNS